MHFIKQFRFMEQTRSQLTFSDSSKVRLDPKDHRLEITREKIKFSSGQDVYYTDADLYIKTWISTPADARQILGFEVNPTSNLLPEKTRLLFRIADSQNEYYWDGNAWVIAGVSDWNTEAEVAANISSFPFLDRKIGFVINLFTSDGEHTPYVESISILLDVEGDYVFDLIGKSLVGILEKEFGVIKELAINTVGGSMVDLSDLETPFEIGSVEAAYNHTVDPLHTNDLYSAYDATSKTLTLSSSVNRGEIVWVRFAADTPVYLNWGSTYYTEIEKVPSLVLDDLDMRFVQNEGEASVRNMASYTARVQRKPFRATFTIGILLLAESSATLLRMVTASRKFIVENPFLVSIGLDEKYTLMGDQDSDFRPRPSLSDKRNASFSVTIKDVYMWLTDAEEKFLVRRLIPRFDDDHLHGRHE